MEERSSEVGVGVTSARGQGQGRGSASGRVPYWDDSSVFSHL